MWIDEAIVLGAKDSLRFVAKQLWFRYLRELGVAFQHKDSNEKLSKFPTYRDLQVAITGRKRLISAEQLGRWIQGKKREPKKTVTDESDFDDDAVRKRRRKERRSFLKTLNREDSASIASGSRSSTQGDDSEESDDEFSSSMPPSTPKSEFSIDDDSFGLSLSFSTSMNNGTSSVEPELETDSNRISSGISGTDSDTCSEFGGSKNNEDKEIDVHMNVLENINFSQIFKQKQKFIKSEKTTRLDSIKRPTVKIVFSLFCLAVMLTEDNWMTLSDLTFWADSGAIHYKSCVMGIPQDMKLSGRADYNKFLPRKDATAHRNDIEEHIIQLGALLKLKKVDFASSKKTFILDCIGRFIRELSLPAVLVRKIENKLEKLVLAGFKFNFLTSEQYCAKRQNSKFIDLPSLDVYCLALILFVLKYDFGLDDRTEILLSSAALLENSRCNTDLPHNRYFVFSEWLELSKRRVYLVAKYCYHLQTRYTMSLLPEVEPSLPCMVRSLEDISLHAESIKSHLCGVKSTSDTENWSNTDSHSVTSDSHNTTSDSLNMSDSSMSDSSNGSTVSQYGWEAKRGYYMEEHEDIFRVSKLLKKEFPSSHHQPNSDNNTMVKSIVKKNTLDLCTSDTPLHDFSLKQLEYNTNQINQLEDNSINVFEYEDKVRLDDAQKLGALIDKYDQEIFIPTENLERNANQEHVLNIQEDLNDFMLAPLNDTKKLKKEFISSGSSNSISKILLTSVKERLPTLEKEARDDANNPFFKRRYWMSHFKNTLPPDISDTSDIYSCPKDIENSIISR